MLHAGHGPDSRERAADRDLEGDLLVHGPFRVNAFYARKGFEHFGARRAGVGCREFPARLDESPGNGFIAGKNRFGQINTSKKSNRQGAKVAKKILSSPNKIKPRF